MKKLYYTPFIESCKLCPANILWAGSTKPEPKSPARNGDAPSVKLTKMYI